MFFREYTGYVLGVLLQQFLEAEQDAARCNAMIRAQPGWARKALCTAASTCAPSANATSRTGSPRAELIPVHDADRLRTRACHRSSGRRRQPRRHRSRVRLPSRRLLDLRRARRATRDADPRSSPRFLPMCYKWRCHRQALAAKATSRPSSSARSNTRIAFSPGWPLIGASSIAAAETRLRMSVTCGSPLSEWTAFSRTGRLSRALDRRSSRAHPGSSPPPPPADERRGISVEKLNRVRRSGHERLVDLIARDHPAERH